MPTGLLNVDSNVDLQAVATECIKHSQYMRKTILVSIFRI